MARPRTPPAKAKLTGAAVKNPGRYAGRNDPSSPILGEPSRWLPANHKRAWRMFVEELPWLVEADRAMMELASGLRASLIAGTGGMNVSSAQIYSAVLSKLGASPVDRSRAPAPDQERLVDEFFGEA